MQHFFILISKSNIMELDLRLSRMCLDRKMLFSCVGKFRFLQYSLNAIQCGVHHGQAGRLAIERLERPEQVKDEQKDTKYISQRERIAPLQKYRQAKNRSNPDSIKDI